MANNDVLFLFPEMEKEYRALERVLKNGGRKLLLYENMKTGKIGIHDLEKEELPADCRRLHLGRKRTGTILE